MEALESTLLVSQNTSDKLSEELHRQSAEPDRLHQYSQRNCIIVSGIPVKKNKTCEDLQRSFQKNLIKDVGENSKEEFDFEYDKIHRHGKVNDIKQNVIVRFRSNQYPSDLYYARKKN